jgi:proline-specific peptidase
MNFKKSVLIKFAAIFAFVLTIGGNLIAGENSTEGFIDVPGGKVWYRKVGSGNGTPLLVLHGGPGVPSYYLKPLAALGDDRPVIFYDQLGAGHSDHVNDTSLWTMSRFLDELRAVREALGLTKVHLYGHSWGAMLACDYLLTKPDGVESCILASPPISIPRWQHDADSLVGTLPDSVQTIIRQHEADGTTNAPEYQNAMMQFYSLYLARKQPWSADIDSSFAQMNPTLYDYMNGPSEFAITGTYRNYDRTAQLHEIDVPTLFIVGQYDEAVPSTVRDYQRLVPNSEMVVVPDAGHLAMQDNPTYYVKALRDFLRKVDGK